MTDLEIGASVIYRERVHTLRGFTSMSVTPRRVLLEDSDGNPVEVLADEICPVAGDEPRVGNTHRPVTESPSGGRRFIS